MFCERGAEQVTASRCNGGVKGRNLKWKMAASVASSLLLSTKSLHSGEMVKREQYS